MRNPLAAAGSLAIHIWVLSMILEAATMTPPPPPPPVHTKYIDKPIVLRGRDALGAGLACGHDYKGIGVAIQFGSNVVTQVGPGTPAERAGVRVGDVLVNADDLFTTFPEGTHVKVLIARDGQRLNLDAVIEKVCDE